MKTSSCHILRELKYLSRVIGTDRTRDSEFLSNGLGCVLISTTIYVKVFSATGVLRIALDLVFILVTLNELGQVAKGYSNVPVKKSVCFCSE